MTMKGPGGWLQWDEIDSLGAYVAHVDSTETPAINEWLQWIKGTSDPDTRNRE